MRKILFVFVFIFIFLFFTIAFADPLEFSKIFKGKSACFIVLDLNKNKIITTYNAPRCAHRIAPDSTFKIPLSVMAFDQNIITQKTVFKWDGADKGLPQWNQNQTPHTWLTNSVVWISQKLTVQLGIEKIKDYLRKFNYGNQDFSGDPDENNGLTHAWLSSSLKISGNEQLSFLIRLVNNSLPASLDAQMNTKQNMYLGTSANGWKLYAKSGSGHTTQGNKEGWFIGYTQRDVQTYLFIFNFTDLKSSATSQVTQIPNATRMAKSLLKQLNLI